MIGSILRRLDRGGDATRPLVEFVAYASDCRVTGQVQLTEARLSDMLNRRGEVAVSDAVVTSYVGTPDLDLQELTLYRGDLFAVILAGPRGDQEKRRPTEAVPLGIKLGPYLVRGHIHVTPGTDAVAAFKRGREMIALTDGWIVRADGPDSSKGPKTRVAAILVNRLLAEWVTPAMVDDPVDADEPEVEVEVAPTRRSEDPDADGAQAADGASPASADGAPAAAGGSPADTEHPPATESEPPV